MRIYTLSDARRKLSEVLEQATREGEVRIQRADGRVFTLKPWSDERSPLDVKGPQTDLSRDEIVGIVREGRERG